MNTKTRVISAVWFLLVANYLDRVAISFAGPSIMKSLSMSPSSFGVVLSSFGIGYLLAQMPGGILADRWGAKPLLVIGPILWALFTGATGLVTSLVGFVVVRALFGLSEGLSNASIYKMIGDTFNSVQRARAMSICVTAIALAPAFAGPLVGVFLSVHGWQGVFFMMTVPALLAALINYLLLPGSGTYTGTEHHALHVDSDPSLRGVFGSLSLWILSIGHVAYNIAYWGYLGWMPSYLALARHIDVKSIGPLGGIPYVFAFFGLLLGGWLGSSVLHRFRPQLVAICHLCAGVSLFLAYQAGTLSLALAGLSSAAFFLYGGQGPGVAIMLDLSPERTRGTFVGVVNTASQIGGAVAPATIGFLVSSTGSFAGGFGFMIVGLCVAAASMLALIPLLNAKPHVAVAAI